MQGLSKRCSSYMIDRTKAILIDNIEDSLKTLECIRQDSLKTIEPRQLKDTCILVKDIARALHFPQLISSPYGAAL